MSETPPTYTRDDLQKDLLRGMVAEPLLTEVRTHPEEFYDIIIALNEDYPGENGTEGARRLVTDELKTLNPAPVFGPDAANYIFVRIQGQQILDLAKTYRKWLREQKDKRLVPIYRVWQDQEIRACINQSISTVKADACHRAFNSLGKGILWAVIDSGIDATHPHFKPDTIETSLCQDFTNGGNALKDEFGHGTHVAGIIAGKWDPAEPKPFAASELLCEEDSMEAADGKLKTEVRLTQLDAISGIAPSAQLVSFKVLNAQGVGKASAVMQAIDQIQQINKNGRWLRIHGVNLSLGYDFNPKWFGCGQSPLCVEVDRLVRSGVVVVVAAGNSGFSALNLAAGGAPNQLGYRDQSINDPGNAELAITVGATHREKPHTYGVSFFSSRGPTGDGRMKPDIVAPGERIISCAAGGFLTVLQNKLSGQGPSSAASQPIHYLEQSGTSMAAPHVSGAIAAFLSARREFIGQPEKVKRLFLENAISLKREPNFQGYGLLDLLKVLQAV